MSQDFITKLSAVPQRAGGHKTPVTTVVKEDNTVMPAAPSNSAPATPDVQTDIGIPQRKAPISNKPELQHAVSIPSLPAVKSMQSALINLSKLIAQDIPEYQSNADTNEHRENAHSWLDFLASKYTNMAPHVGKEFANANVTQPTKSESANQNSNFKSIINTLGRVGSPQSGETKIDGVWGWRTTNALKQVYSLAYSIIQIQKDMGLNVGYDDSDLTDFSSNLSSFKDKTEPPLNLQSSLAVEFTKNIDKFSRAYTDFRDKVLHNDKFKLLINQDKALVNYKKKSEDELTPQEQALWQNSETVLSTTVGGKNIGIRPIDFKNISTFKSWLSSVAKPIGLEVDTSNQAIVNKYLQEAVSNLKASAL